MPRRHCAGMIDHKTRTIFIHQRKVAGLSIIAAWGIKPSQPDFHRYNDGVLSWDWRRRSAPEDAYFVFSAVRNPFDRLISSWKYLRSTRNLTLHDVLRNPPMQGHDYRHLTRSQVAILREPGANNLVVHDLIRFETLQPDFDRICDRVGRPRQMLPHLNSGHNKSSYQSYFDPYTRRLAEALFSEDLAAFKYEF